MAYDIGPRVGVEGESQYMSDIKRIRESIKTLGAQMDVVTTSYLNNEKSVESLAQQQAILEKQIALTKEKIADQATMAGKSAAEYGEAAEETQKWERALAESQSELNKLKSRLSSVGDEMDDLGKDTDDVEKNLKDAGDAGLKFGDILKANVLSDAITGGIKALGSAIKNATSALVDFAKSGIEVASDLDEVQNVVDVTFGASGAEAIEDFAQKAATSFGMSSLSAKEFTGTMGAMLKSMGLTEDQVLDMSTDLVGLAGDLASFYNLDVDEAFAKIRSGISGETEPLKQLGINMSVANLEAYALAQGIETAYKDMTQAEQATLRYNYLLSATADAQGDFARTSDSYANQQKIMELNMENLSATIGTKLLPYMTELTSALNGLLSGETDIGAFAASIGQMVIDATGKVMEGLPTLLSAGGQMLSTLVQGVRELLPTLAEAAVEILTELLGGLLEGLPLFLETGVEMLTTLVTAFAESLPDLIPTIVETVTALIETLTMPEVLGDIIDAALVLITSLAEGLIKAIPAIVAAVPEIIKNLVSTLVESAPKIIAAGVDLLGSLILGMVGAIPDLIATTPKIMAAIVGGLVEGIVEIALIGKQIVEGLWNGIKSMATWIKDKVKGFFSGVVDGVKDLLGIHSPSKVFAGIGGYMAEGLGEGFGQEIKGVQRDIDRSMADLVPDVSSAVSVSATGQAAAGQSVSNGTDMAAAFREALSGMAVYLDGRKVGTMVSIYQKGQSRSSGVPVTLG